MDLRAEGSLTMSTPSQLDKKPTSNVDDIAAKAEPFLKSESSSPYSIPPASVFSEEDLIDPKILSMDLDEPWEHEPSSALVPEDNQWKVDALVKKWQRGRGIGYLVK